MSITLKRAQRKTDVVRATTPSNVGPGLYEPLIEQQISRIQKENVAPFNSMKERPTQKEQLNGNPGPGTYASVKVKVLSKPEDKMMNSFVTQIPRFCPTQPGSSAFVPPTYINNPGPGNYQFKPKWDNPMQMAQKRDKYSKVKNKGLKIKPQLRAASIPSRKISQNAYSGKGHDTVGPAVYDPQMDTIKNQSIKGDFHSSKDKRQLFEPTNQRENKQVPKENPGPGQYEQVYNQAEKRHFNSQGGTSIFLSKVPNAGNLKTQHRAAITPGPGHYDKQTKSMLNQSTIEANSQAIYGNQNAMADQAILDQNFNLPHNKSCGSFLTKAKRSDQWANALSAPFTKQTFIANPAPNAYKVDGKSKKDDVKSKILVEEAINVPFGSSDMRHCQKVQNKEGNPGPGAYIDVNNPKNSSLRNNGMTMTDEERKLAEKGGARLGAFGTSTVTRFENSWLKPKDGPAPGQYSKDVNKTEEDNMGMMIRGKSAAQLGSGKAQGIFKSHTERFITLEPNNAQVRLLRQGGRAKSIVTQNNKGEKEIFTSESMGINNQVSCLNQGLDWNKQTRAKDYETFVGKKVSFDSTSNRFNYNQVFHGQSLKFDIPGPGSYSRGKSSNGSKTYTRPATQQAHSRKVTSVAFNSQEKRFKLKGNNSFSHQIGTTTVVGPGAYLTTTCDNSMVKKSYNMSMEHSYFL